MQARDHKLTAPLTNKDAAEDATEGRLCNAGCWLRRALQGSPVPLHCRTCPGTSSSRISPDFSRRDPHTAHCACRTMLSARESKEVHKVAYYRIAAPVDNTIASCRSQRCRPSCRCACDFQTRIDAASSLAVTNFPFAALISSLSSYSCSVNSSILWHGT